MTGPTASYPPPGASVSKDGTRVVLETRTADGQYRQVIFVRAHDGWQMSVCTPGVGAIHLTNAMCAVVARALNIPGKG